MPRIDISESTLVGFLLLGQAITNDPDFAPEQRTEKEDVMMGAIMRLLNDWFADDPEMLCRYTEEYIRPIGRDVDNLMQEGIDPKTASALALAAVAKKLRAREAR